MSTEGRQTVQRDTGPVKPGAVLDIRPTHRLRVSTRFRVPIERVWSHKTDPHAQMAEFPPWMPFRVTRPEALRAALDAGALELRSPARLGPLPWEVRMRVVERGRQTIEVVRTRGMHLLVHRRLMEPAAGGTHYTDDLWFAPAAMPQLVARLFRRTFVNRHQRAAQVLEADPRTVGQAVLRQVLDDEVLPTYIGGVAPEGLRPSHAP